MEEAIFAQPLIPFLTLIILSIGDLVLGLWAGSLYVKYTAPIMMYETALHRQGKRPAGQLLVRTFIKMLPAFLILAIWQLSIEPGMAAIKYLYWLLLGFALTIYLIIDLRHLESLLIATLIKRKRGWIEGKLLIKSQFSLRQSAIQLLTILIILLFILFLNHRPFYIGAALAPLSLIIRNLALSRP